MDVANVRRGGGSKGSKFTRRSIVLVVILLGLETFVMQLFHAPDYGLSASDHSPGSGTWYGPVRLRTPGA